MNQFTMPFGLPRLRQWCGDDSGEIGMLKKAIRCQARVPATAYAQFAAFSQSSAEISSLGSLSGLPLAVVSRDPMHNSDFGLSGQRWQKFQTELAQLSTNPIHVFAEGSGHDVPGETPDIVVEAIRRLALGSSS
jgi:hypothetical protein